MGLCRVRSGTASQSSLASGRCSAAANATNASWEAEHERAAQHGERKTRAQMAAMAQRRRSLSRLFHRPHSDGGDAARHGRCRRIRVPGFSPPAAGAFPAGPRKARPQPSAAGGGRRAISLSLQLDRRRPCRIHVRDRSQGLDPLSAAALDLARHRDLRRARRSVARDAARMARQQWRCAWQSQPRLRLHQAERRRPGRPRRLLLRIRPRARDRPAPGIRAPSRSAAVRSRQTRRRCRSRAGRNRGWKKPIAITRWNMCGPPRRSWCNCSVPRMPAISCTSPAS